MIFRALLLAMVLWGGAFADASKADDKIHDLVMVRLAGDQILGGPRGIEVTVQDSTVILTGKVETEKKKTRAGSLAHKVKGVKNVDNQLKVVPR